MIRTASILTLSLTGALALAGCAAQGSKATGSDGHGKNVPAAKVVGEPVNCIDLPIRESRVRDDWTIDFRADGNRWYRNTLPYRCNSLGFDRAFSYATSLQRLCNVDVITVIGMAGGGPIPRATCGLGMFTPVELEK